MKYRLRFAFNYLHCFASLAKRSLQKALVQAGQKIPMSFLNTSVKVTPIQGKTGATTLIAYSGIYGGAASIMVNP